MTVANVTGSAGTFANLTQPANQIGTLGAFSTTAGFALVNNKSLLVAGPVQDTGGASTLALTTTTGDITLAGNVSAANVVDLISRRDNQTGGALVAGTLKERGNLRQPDPTHQPRRHTGRVQHHGRLRAGEQQVVARGRPGAGYRGRTRSC